MKILQEKEIRISRWGSYLGTGGSNKRLSFWSIWVVVLHRALPQEILHLFLDEGGSKPRPLCVIPLYHHLGLHWASAFSARTAEVEPWRSCRAAMLRSELGSQLFVLGCRARRGFGEKGGCCWMCGWF